MEAVRTRSVREISGVRIPPLPHLEGGKVVDRKILLKFAMATMNLGNEDRSRDGDDRPKERRQADAENDFDQATLRGIGYDIAISSC